MLEQLEGICYGKMFAWIMVHLNILVSTFVNKFTYSLTNFIVEHTFKNKFTTEVIGTYS